MNLIAKCYSIARALFSRKPVRLAIVRRYVDANGSYVGELYIEQEQQGVSGYRMIGVSLDTLPLDCGTGSLAVRDALDTANDFLTPMPTHKMRVGALDPSENDRVRAMVARLPRRNMTLIVQNRFIEHVMSPTAPKERT